MRDIRHPFLITLTKNVKHINVIKCILFWLLIPLQYPCVQAREHVPIVPIYAGHPCNSILCVRLTITHKRIEFSA